ncbi:hypothetical protein DFH09DRAFT_1360176 [Mycena vulgaris]|nr:hypothetical protein DFH09DRAFT_1360176 [Mycena vulgaris]
MQAEAGFHFMIGKAWIYTLDEPQKQLRERHAHDLFSVLVAMVSSNSVTFEELLDGVGGLDRLSILVLQYVSYMLETREAPRSQRDIYSLNVMFMFMVDRYRSLLGDPMCRALDPLFIILRDHGAVPILTAAAWTLAETPGSAVAIPLEKCLGALERIFSDISGYRWLSSALKNGLLLAVVLASQLHPGDHVHDHLTFLVTLMSVTSASRIYDQWQQFTDLVQQRVAMLRLYDSHEYVTLRACDDLESIDWRHGDHRAPYGALSPNNRNALNVRGRGFLFSLVHHDYRVAKADIYMRKFDCTIGPVSITVHGEDNESFRAHGEEWAEGVARAARSGGSQELHVVRVIQGRVGRVLLVPLRQSPEDVDGALKETLLREMADELPPGDDEVRLSAFLRKFEVKTDELDGDVLETH